MDDELLTIAELLDAIHELELAIECYRFAIWEQELLEGER
jgi:hypothetical protein